MDKTNNLFLLIFMFILALVSIYTQNLNGYFLLFELIIIYISLNYIGKQKYKLPIIIETMIVVFLIFSIFLGEVLGMYKYWFWEMLVWGLFGMILTLVSFLLFYILNDSKEVNFSLNPAFISLFGFTFSLSFGTIWLIFRSYLEEFLGDQIDLGLDPRLDLLSITLGALFISINGYFYFKYQKNNLVSKLIDDFLKKNSKYFTIESKDIAKLIKNGESSKIEFKSSLRVNLHTKQVDKRMEHSALKSICAFSNTSGGTLLIGVEDDGNILGHSIDKFPNEDKYHLHFINLVRGQIGQKYLHLFRSNLINIEDKYILKIDCVKSDEPIFLKGNNEEEFFIRSGPSTEKLTGSGMLGYIEKRFKE